MSNINGNGTHSATRTMATNDHAAEPARRTKTSSSTQRHGGFPWGWLFLIILAGVLAAAVFFVLTRRDAAEKKLQTSTQQMAVPTVLVVKPQRASDDIHITLPGTVNAWMQSSVYAQVSGYIKKWHFDIGAKVKANDVLAEIETPVTDQQLKQAGESVKQAQANLELAQATSGRYNDLLAKNAVSQQDVDNQNANVKVQAANLSAALAFESGIQKTEEFKQVRAPFDGVVTARRVDVGDFVSATGQTASTGSGPSTGTPNQELFQVAQTNVLRIYVNVPEHYADQIAPGIMADIDLASAPNTPVKGKLTRTAESIDQSSLTLLSEVDVQNTDGKLLPGGYAQVHFNIITSHPPMVVPGNSLIFRAQGPQVGVVDESGKVHLKSIKIGRDLGTKLEVTEGVEESDQIIINPSDSLADGQQVNVDTQQQDKKP